MLHRLVRRCRATAASFFSALEVQYLAVAFDEHAEPCGGIGIIHKGDQLHRLCPLPLRAVSMALPDIRTKPSLSGSKRSEEHTSELPSLMRISYAVFSLTKKNDSPNQSTHRIQY